MKGALEFQKGHGTVLFLGWGVVMGLHAFVMTQNRTLNWVTFTDNIHTVFPISDLIFSWRSIFINGHLQSSVIIIKRVLSAGQVGEQRTGSQLRESYVQRDPIEIRIILSALPDGCTSSW